MIIEFTRNNKHVKKHEARLLQVQLEPSSL